MSGDTVLIQQLIDAQKEHRRSTDEQLKTMNETLRQVVVLQTQMGHNEGRIEKVEERTSALEKTQGRHTVVIGAVTALGLAFAAAVFKFAFDLLGAAVKTVPAVAKAAVSTGVTP